MPLCVCVFRNDKMFPRRLRRRRSSNNNNNDDDDDDLDDFPPFTRMNPFEFLTSAVMEEAVMRLGAGGLPFNSLPRSHFPTALKCPSCLFENPYTPYSASGKQPPLAEENRFSHEARVAFQSGNCPICLDESAGPPMVNLICGHWLCVDCFKQIGGRNGAEALKSREQAGREEYEKYRARMREEHGEEDDDDDPPTPEEALAMLLQMLHPQMFHADDDDDDDDDDFDDYDYHDLDDDDEFTDERHARIG